MGTIRCVHGYYMGNYKDGTEIKSYGNLYGIKGVDYNADDNGIITLTSDGDDCTLKISDGFWLNIMDGCNFTHIIGTEQRIKDYVAQHGERFRFVGHTAGPISIGPEVINKDIWHLVF